MSISFLYLRIFGIFLLFFYPNFNPNDIPVFSILSEKQRIEIKDDFSFIHRREIEVQVLKKEGLEHVLNSIQYNSLSKVLDFRLEFEDPETGKIIEKVRLRDMNDAAVYSVTNAFDDQRFKFYNFQTRKFPITVRVVTEKEYKSNFYLPAWIPVQHYNQQVKESQLEIIFPESMGIRYKALNLLGEFKEEKLPDEMVQFSWIEKDLPVQDRDLKIEDDHRLLLAPIHFSLDGFEGKMEDWNGLASWQYELNKGRDELPEKFKKELQELVKDKEGLYEKVEVLYEYLQKNFRYVSIQLGVGGWQTMTAEEVLNYSYGDCKGLTNLMKAMLNAVGIPSNYTLVQAGEFARDIEIDLPSTQFNHVILQVPTDQDPIWLECTANLIPAGFLGSFTRDRHVLVTGPDGGYLTKTPDYQDEIWNKIQTQSNIQVDQQGNAKIEFSRKYQGIYSERLRMQTQSADEREQRNFLTSQLPIPGLIIQEVQFQNDALDSLPITNISFSGILQRFAERTAKRMILRPFMGDISPQASSSGRLVQEDEFTLELPDNLRLEEDLNSYNLEEAGAQLSFEIEQEDQVIKIKRTIELNIDDEMEEEDKKSLIKKLNFQANRPIHLIKNYSVPNEL